MKDSMNVLSTRYNCGCGEKVKRRKSKRVRELTGNSRLGERTSRGSAAGLRYE